MTRILLICVVTCAFFADSLAASVPLTDCQRRRERELRVTQTQNLTGLVVPECDENGEYLPKQCFGQAVRGPPFCACYDKEFGQIKAPSRKIVSCNCIRQHHEWQRISRSQRGDEPRCNGTSGEFHAVQCSATHHWCVNTTSGVPNGELLPGGCSTDLSSITCAIGGTHHGHEDHGHHGGAHAHHGGSSDQHNSTHSGESSTQHGDTSHQGGSGESGHSGHH
ncbi:saxiphilin-like [Haemaphysalis longicornis]